MSGKKKLAYTQKQNETHKGAKRKKLIQHVKKGRRKTIKEHDQKIKKIEANLVIEKPVTIK